MQPHLNLKISSASLIYLLLSLMQTSACQREPTVLSSPKGHWEQATSDDLQTHKDDQTVIAEYETSRGVVISLSLLTEYHNEDLAVALLASDITSLWIVVPKGYTTQQQSIDLKLLLQLAGDHAEKIQVLPHVAEGRPLVWARDWSPLTARAKNGQLRFLDFNYYPFRKADDNTPQMMATALDIEKISLPIYAEGGNFMINRQGSCILSTRVTYANNQIISAEDMTLSPAQIESYYRDYVGCKKVTIFPTMPYENTGHVDLWAKFIDDKTVMVNEVRDEILQLPGYSALDLPKVREIKEYLDDRARDLSHDGYKVVRIPMPAPLFYRPHGVFRSYTNSLILNGLVIIPRYESLYASYNNSFSEYIDKSLLQRYEAYVEAAHKELGYSVQWIVSDKLIADGGAVHCATMQIAK